MAAVDLDLLLHHTIRTFMCAGGLSADDAYDKTIAIVVDVIEELTGDLATVALYRTLLPELRESLLPPYRKPQPDLTDLEPVILAMEEEAARCQRQRRKRRQLGGRP